MTGVVRCLFVEIVVLGKIKGVFRVCSCGSLLSKVLWGILRYYKFEIGLYEYRDVRKI